MTTSNIDPGAVEDVKDRAAVEMASLEDLYADKPSRSSTPARAEEPAPVVERAEPEPAKPVEEPAKPAKADKAASADDDEPEPNDVTGLKAALKATRQKAREKGTKADEYERRAQEFERKFTEADGAARELYARVQQGGQQNQRPAPPDANLDPGAALAYQEQTWAARLQAVEVKAEHDAYMARVVASQRILKKDPDFADYDAMEVLFKSAADADPRLWQEIRRHEFPAEYAYNVGKQVKQNQEIQAAGSFDKYIEQKVAEKLAAAVPATPTVPTSQSNLTPAAPRAPPPQSLARVPSVTPRNQGKSFNGPTPLTDLYK